MNWSRGFFRLWVIQADIGCFPNEYLVSLSHFRRASALPLTISFAPSQKQEVRFCELRSAGLSY